MARGRRPRPARNLGRARTGAGPAVPRTLAPSGNAPWRRCIVAEDVVDGVAIPVAAAVVHEASLHPERLWAYVEVDRTTAAPASAPHC